MCKTKHSRKTAIDACSLLCANQLLYNLSLIKLCSACVKQNTAERLQSMLVRC